MIFRRTVRVYREDGGRMFLFASRSLVVVVFPGIIILAFERHVTVYMYVARGFVAIYCVIYMWIT